MDTGVKFFCNLRLYMITIITHTTVLRLWSMSTAHSMGEIWLTVSGHITVWKTNWTTTAFRLC